MRTYNRYTDEAITAAVRDSENLSQAIKKLGGSGAGGTHTHIRNRVTRLGLDTSHFRGREYYLQSHNLAVKKHWSEYLVYREGAHNRQHGYILTRALRESGREYVCVSCGLGEVWNGQPFALEVHHLSEDWTDDRAENLEFMCPNCHTQLRLLAKLEKLKTGKETKTRVLLPKTYNCSLCGGVRVKGADKCKDCYNVLSRKCERPSAETLFELLWQEPTSVISKRFGVSDNAVAKWAKQYGLSKPPRGYWQKLKHGKV